MAGLNKIMLIGGLTRDVEVKYSQSGTAIATVNLATSETWFDKKTNEKKEETQYHRVVFWGKNAENIGRYCEKGSQLYVEGKMKHRSYEQDGQTKYISEVNAVSFQFLSSKSQSSNSQANQQQGFQAPQQQGFQNGNYQTPQQQQFQQGMQQPGGGGFQNQNNAGFQNQGNQGFSSPPEDD